MTTLELTAETIEVRPGEGGNFVTMAADGEYFYLSPEDCLVLSRALVKAAAEALGVRA